MSAEISPVKAPDFSQWQFSAPTPMLVPSVSVERGLQVGVGHADHDAAAGVRDQRLELFDQGFRLGAGLVHLPVAGDDGLAQVLVHSMSSCIVMY